MQQRTAKLGTGGNRGGRVQRPVVSGGCEQCSITRLRAAFGDRPRLSPSHTERYVGM